MRERVVQIFKRSSLVMTSLVIALSTVAPLAMSNAAGAVSVGPFSAESVCGDDNTVTLNLSLKETLPGWFLGGNLYYKTPFGNSPKHWLGINDTDKWSINTGSTVVGSVSVSAQVKDPLFGSTIRTYTLMSDALDCTPPAEITVCASTSTVKSTSLDAWDLDETRATGHNDIVEGGLRVWTEGATSTDKAAGYLPVNFALQDLGYDTTAMLTYTVNEGTIAPGAQLVVDFDSNGTPDGILVGEQIYGNNWWLSNSSQQFVKDNAPHIGGGYGSNYYGTAKEWLNAFRDARVLAIGYSLGSGVKGDYTITKITAGCVDYTFGPAPGQGGVDEPGQGGGGNGSNSGNNGGSGAGNQNNQSGAGNSLPIAASNNEDVVVYASTEDTSKKVEDASKEDEVLGTESLQGETLSTTATPKEWSVVNVLLAAAVAAMSVITLAGVRGSEGRARTFRLLTIAPAVAAVVAVLLVEDFSTKLGFVNGWTLLFAVAVAAQVALMSQVKSAASK